MARKIIFMPHANIQYSQLPPEKRLWVIENCYKKLFTLVKENDYKIAFEASGKTVEEIAEKSPETMALLKELIASGNIEPVSSPYIHFMPANIPEELCVHSLVHALDTWEKFTGKRPTIGWNPECGWASHIPAAYKKAGIKTLIMDADSFYLSFDEIRKATGLNYDVFGHSNKNQLFKIEEFIKDKPEFLKYLTNPSVTKEGLQMIFRTDSMANLLLWYLMGATEGMRKVPVSRDEIKQMLTNWQSRIDESGSFIMPYAEDAEYIGSSAYFYVKQFNQARFFEEEPKSVERFKEIIETAKSLGYELSTPSEVIASGNLIENDLIDRIENGVAWHGGTAKAWMNTDFSRIMDPVCNNMFTGIKAICNYFGKDVEKVDGHLDKALRALADAWVSDSRWPPAPTSPGRFNVKESIAAMYLTNDEIEKAMAENGIAEKKSLYSHNLMKSQIAGIEKILMDIKYFGE